MNRALLITFALILFALAAFANNEVVNPVLLGVNLPVYGRPINVDYTHSFSPMGICTIPPFPPFHDLDVYIAGDTYYEMQHNSTKGRNIAVDPDGGVHIAWTDGITPTYTQRRAKYNYFHIDSVRAGDPSSGWVCGFDGAQADGRDRAGFVNVSVNDYSTVPTVAYHDNRGTENLKSNAAFDAMYYVTGGANRCVFLQSEVGPDPYYVPEWPTFDCVAIWPKIAQLDTTVFMVSTCSNSSDTIPATGEEVGQRVIYYRGFVKDVASVPQLVFEPPIEMVDEQTGITCDLAAWSGEGRTEVAMAFISRDQDIVADPFYCDAPNYYTTLYDAATIMVRRSQDLGETWSPEYYITEPYLHIYSDYPDSIYLGWELDSSVTPPETVHVYRPVYGRPTDFNITYSPEGKLHAVWGEFLMSPHEGWETSTEAPCSVGAWRNISVICHWDEERGVIDTVTYDPMWLFRPPADYRPETTPISQSGPSHEPQVTVDEDGNVFVFWHQRWSEYWWCDQETLFIDNSALNYPNSEIYCAVFSPDSGYWSDPLNISNTFTPGCSTGSCWSEIELTVADRVDDHVHLMFIIDKCAGVYIHEFGEVALADVAYMRLPRHDLVRAAYSGGLISDTTHISERDMPTMPKDYRLGSAYPNPFNAATAFWFDTYKPGHYTVEIIDVTGRMVSKIHDGDLDIGRRRFVWDGMSDNGWYVPSGTYFLRAKDADGNFSTRKVTLLK
ncbi:MAG TPA: T9SS type A sorting domain-containing protein [candidate division Zixibacteria bacterium]|nr:T9SS type A sorting domain-containing protein [candidate division Zixibacteria bacterium]